MIKHFLSAKMSKTHFEHDEYGIVRFRKSIANHEQFNLTPLIVVGVTLPDLQFSHHKYYSKGEPISLSSVLTEFWSIDKEIYEAGVRVTGKPDVLIIEHKLKPLLSAEFHQWLNDINVKVEYADGKDRKFTAKMRFMQDDFYVHPRADDDYHQNFPTVNKKEPFPLRLKALNNMIKDSYHHLGIHQLPPKTRDILSSVYGERTELRPFNSHLEIADCKFSTTAFKSVTNNDRKIERFFWVNAKGLQSNDFDGRTLYLFDYGYASTTDPETQDTFDKYSFYNSDDFFADRHEHEEEEENEVLLNTANWRHVNLSDDSESDPFDELLIGPRYQRPIHRWIVTDQRAPEPWWGDGYVIHTGTPSFVAVWGFATLLEAQAMTAHVPTKDGGLAICFDEYLEEPQIDEETKHQLMNNALSAVIDWLLDRQE